MCVESDFVSDLLLRRIYAAVREGNGKWVSYRKLTSMLGEDEARIEGLCLLRSDVFLTENTGLVVKLNPRISSNRTLPPPPETQELVLDIGDHWAYVNYWDPRRAGTGNYYYMLHRGWCEFVSSRDLKDGSFLPNDPNVKVFAGYKNLWLACRSVEDAEKYVKDIENDKGVRFKRNECSRCR